TNGKRSSMIGRGSKDVPETSAKRISKWAAITVAMTAGLLPAHAFVECYFPTDWADRIVPQTARECLRFSSNAAFHFPLPVLVPLAIAVAFTVVYLRSGGWLSLKAAVGWPAARTSAAQSRWLVALLAMPVKALGRHVARWRVVYSFLTG